MKRLNLNHITNKTILAVKLISIGAVVLLANPFAHAFEPNNKISWWKFQSIDTMKYSRDLAREKAEDKDFENTIDDNVKAIAETGATHVAIATPYDSEFNGFLRKWVNAARKYNLNVWYRGNFSGWEGWFEYSKISREEHIAKTREFIDMNKDLFEDGDVFTACPECENGGPGDPRSTGDVEGFRKFFVDEYTLTQNEFFKLNKAVYGNFNSMNGDVAKLIMDKKTTQSMGGIVAVDHYVESPQKLADDISILAASSGGKVVLGEFGAPIPDIHGEMTSRQQASWITDALSLLSEMPEVYGINYWTHTSSSTEIWKEDGQPKDAVDVVTKYFTPESIEIKVVDETNKKISGAQAVINGKNYIADENGKIKIPYVKLLALVNIEAAEYETQETSMVRLKLNPNIVLTKSEQSLSYMIKKLLVSVINSLKALTIAK